MSTAVQCSICTAPDLSNRIFIQYDSNQRSVFHENLKVVFYAERKVLTALPKMAKAVNSDGKTLKILSCFKHVTSCNVPDIKAVQSR